MLIGGAWIEKEEKIDVLNPYDGSVAGQISKGTREDVDLAVSAAKQGLEQMRELTAGERAAILLRAAGRMKEEQEQLARLIAQEVGKTITEARGEVARAINTFALSSEEAKRIHGETIPMDAAPAGKGKFGFYIRVPVGIIAAISPFNFPLNLVAHKIAPALAAGNAVVVKPATVAPLIALELGRILMDCGLPTHALNIVTGPGSEIGDALCSHPDVRMVTFTGSLAVGEGICRTAGLKKITMELGSNSPVILMDDADIEVAVRKIRTGGYALAGQVCISTQRVIVHRAVWDEFMSKIVPAVSSLKMGDPLEDTTELGPMVTASELRRAKEWIDEAVAGGARLECGGKTDGSFLTPAVITGEVRTSKVWTSELFAPAIVVVPAEDLDEAILLANDSAYGLQAGIFTRRIHDAFRASREIETGGVMVNDVPTFRVDHMPYGGVKSSGLGREGPRFAVEEMTDIRVVSFCEGL
ncbi:MAG: aldehyde dehydrogenase family protein [Candidatus Eisenbacteria sp.]|nr:aldehyde dehydrogenase family protein [Candidatus Eisenbacteria bacterium]